MDLSIIIVSYNHSDMLRKTLHSICTSKQSLDFEVFVVDNASWEDNVKIIKEEFPQVKLIVNSKNLGFTHANNQAMRRCQGDFILMLNPDVEVIDGSLNKLVEFMRHNPQAGAAGGRLLYPDGSLQMSCRNFYTLPTILLKRTFLKNMFPQHKLVNRHLMSNWNHDNIRIVDWVFGACLIVRRRIIEELGFLDERFFMYFEDVDLCYRLKQRGLKTYYVPQASFIHFHRRDSAKGLFNKRLIWHIKSMFQFYRKCCFLKTKGKLR